MTGPREVQWRRFCETMAPQRDEWERRAALCRALWPQDCALTMKTAGELRENTFLFQLPWDMEQTYQPVHFENGIDWGFVLNGDQEFTFQMNRHRYWICLGQAYALTGDLRRMLCEPADRLDRKRALEERCGGYHLAYARCWPPGRLLGTGYGLVCSQRCCDSAGGGAFSGGPGDTCKPLGGKPSHRFFH